MNPTDNQQAAGAGMPPADAGAPGAMPGPAMSPDPTAMPAAPVAGTDPVAMPGAAAPNLIGALLMLAAGACWGAYSLAGRSSRDPLAATSGNFWRATILGTAALVFLMDTSSLTWRGAVLAAVSGSLASGVGYTLWYAALPSLSAWRAALLQLAVPVITALAASFLLAEAIPGRLLVATVLVFAGVLLSLPSGRRR